MHRSNEEHSETRNVFVYIHAARVKFSRQESAGGNAVTAFADVFDGPK